MSAPRRMTDAERKFARHALGLSRELARGRSYRNRFIASPGSDAWAAWEGMAEAGLARRIGATTTFQLTFAGAQAALDRGETLDPEDFPEAAK